MESVSHVAESVAAGASVEMTETPISTYDDPAVGRAFGVEAVAECEPINEPKKDDNKTDFEEQVNAYSHKDNAETSSDEAAAGQENIGPCSQVKQLETAAINLVVEVNADAELARGKGLLGEQSMQREADSSDEVVGDTISSVQTRMLGDRKESEMASPVTTSEAAHQVEEKSSIESIQQVSQESETGVLVATSEGAHQVMKKSSSGSILIVGSKESETGVPFTTSEAEHQAIEKCSVASPQQVVNKESETGGSDEAPEAAYQVTENSSIQGIQGVGNKDFEMEGTVTTFEAPHQTVGRELETAIQREVECISLGSLDEIKSCEGKFQTREDSKRLSPEETLGCTSGLEERPVNVLDLATGSLQTMKALTNEEESRKGDVFELAEKKVEASTGTMSYRKRAVEEHFWTDDLQASELSEGVVDGERKKGRMTTVESVKPGERGSVLVLERQADLSIFSKVNDKSNFVDSLGGNLGEEARDTRRQHGLTSMMMQTERGIDRVDSERGGIQSGFLESSERNGKVKDRTHGAEKIAIMKEAMESKVDVREGSKSCIRTDIDTVMSAEQRTEANVWPRMENMVGDGTKEGRQKLLHDKEAGVSKSTSYTRFTQSHQVMECGTGGGAKQVMMQGNKCNQDKNGAANQDKKYTLAGHIQMSSRKEFTKVVKDGKEAERRETTNRIFGQDGCASSVASGSLQFSSSNNVTVEASHKDVLQPKRQQIPKAHSEMQVRRQAENLHGGVEGFPGRVSRELPISRSKEETQSSTGQHWRIGIVMKVKSKADMPAEDIVERGKDTIVKDAFEEHQGWDFQGAGYDDSLYRTVRRTFEEEKTGSMDEANTGTSEEERFFRDQLETGVAIEKASQKRKLSDNVVSDSGATNEPGQSDNVVKKAKKKAVNVWAKTTSRKGPKKNNKNGGPQNPSNEDAVLLTPVYVNPDKMEDGPDQSIALSKYDKAEKIELSENRLSASSTKGYRMVRATRGVQEGTWYYEIIVEQLGPTGHTRLGWSTQKGDVQAPVGFDSNSYGYRDLDGSKTHVAVREPYGDLYVEGDVIGFYIHLPNGAEYAPRPAPLFSYRGRPYLSDVKEEQPRRVPGSEICFFRNGVCQGTAFKDIYGGRYFPAASMYTLPKEPSCIVRFNFGPDFLYPPVDIDGRSAPTAMVHAPYHNVLSGKEVTPTAYANISATGVGTQSIEPQMKIL